MKSRVIFPLVAVATLFVTSQASAFGLLNRMCGCGCAAPACCEATCAAAEPSCGCAAAAEPSCGCAPACGDKCCDSCNHCCCRPTPVRDLLANLRCRLASLRCCCHNHGCCEASCGCAAEPACGCAK